VVRGGNGYSLGSHVFFSTFATGLIERYPELFEGGSGVTSEHQVRFSKKWGTYAAITELANGAILKIDDVVKEPLEKCLLFLAYKADKSTLEGLLHKEAMKNIGNSR
jgi:hypothetical protein